MSLFSRMAAAQRLAAQMAEAQEAEAQKAEAQKLAHVDEVKANVIEILALQSMLSDVDDMAANAPAEAMEADARAEVALAAARDVEAQVLAVSEAAAASAERVGRSEARIAQLREALGWA